VWQKARIFLDIYVPGYGSKVRFLTLFGLNNNKKARDHQPLRFFFVILLNSSAVSDRILTDLRGNAATR
jgi:hypothetical protein